MSEGSRDRRASLTGLLRQPLLQFLVLGLALYGLYAQVADRRPQESRQKIVVSASQIELLASLWERQWRRPPTTDELDGLIRSHVREEVLYREALAMGLDRDDTVIRRRLAQKIEFMAQDLAAQAEPSAAELEIFFAEHPEIFEQPARITFVHVFINVDTHGEASPAEAERVLGELRAGGDPRQLGDRFMLQSAYLRKSSAEVARHFGGDFSAAVFELRPGEWTGPLRSGYGLHLVRVDDREDAFLPPLAEVSDRVRDELISYRKREMDERLYDHLLGGYEVVIEEVEAAGGESS